MRHRKRRGQLKVSPSHLRAMRRNLVASLFTHGRVTTTVAKAKAFRPFAEKLITLAREGNRGKAEGTPEGNASHLHAVRRAARLMPHKPAVRRLFRDVAPAVGERPGGYTRIIRLGTSRLGDRAPQAMFMLVDTPGEDEEADAAATATAKKGKGKKEKAASK